MEVINNENNNESTVAGGIARRWRRPGAHNKYAEGRRVERVMRGVARETRESAAWQDRGEPVEDRTVECLTWTVGDDEGAHRREEKSDRRRANNRKYEDG